MEISTPTPADPPKRSRIARLQRAAGGLILLVGVALLVWAFVVWRWNDPVTGLYTRWEQHQLVAAHDRFVRQFEPEPLPPKVSPEQLAAEIRRDARRLLRQAPDGAPIGRIIVPRLSLNVFMVNGTSTSVLKKGPGVDQRAFIPGQGQLVYVAGHRTTYLAPFAKIDALEPGDRVTLKMPYGTFDYAVIGHQIVDAHDMSVLRSHGREVVALQACHPRFFASHRFIVWAKPIATTRGGAARPRAVTR